MSGILCQICRQHTAATFDELVVHILYDRNQVETKLVAKDHVYGACHYRHPGLTCRYNEQIQQVTVFMAHMVGICTTPYPGRSSSVIADRHLPQSSTSLRNTRHIPSFLPLLLVPSLKAWCMHSFGLNYKYHDFAVYADKACSMVWDVFSDPTTLPMPKFHFST